MAIGSKNRNAFAIDAGEFHRYLCVTYFWALQQLEKASNSNHYQTETMTNDPYKEIFTPAILQELFPADRSNNFFEALYGDTEEGAYDIELAYQGYAPKSRSLHFIFNLQERPGKCLACHLTHGLPEVFTRHPVIGVTGLVSKINALLAGRAECGDWQIGATQNLSRQLYGIPLTIKLR